MKTQQKSLGLLGLSIGIGSLLTLIPIDLVHAGNFNRDIIHNDEKMGHVEFTWDDDKISGSSIKDFRLLESFSFTDYSGTEYDLDFVKNEAFIRLFNFNLITENLTAHAYKFSFDVPTAQIGFKLSSIEDSLGLANTDDTPNYHSVVADLSQSDVAIPDVILEEVETEPNDTTSVPESSLATALLMVAGFVLIGSKKAF
ncbi:MAG: hypothetical protein QNJ64_09900 [Crocosphaera sp.]|nr:hypothetical protein [Crocosphaera sp.]